MLCIIITTTTIIISIRLVNGNLYILKNTIETVICFVYIINIGTHGGKYEFSTMYLEFFYIVQMRTSLNNRVKII
jgi:hypothetical protein